MSKYRTQQLREIANKILYNTPTIPEMFFKVFGNAFNNFCVSSRFSLKSKQIIFVRRIQMDTAHFATVIFHSWMGIVAIMISHFPILFKIDCLFEILKPKSIIKPNDDNNVQIAITPFQLITSGLFKLTELKVSCIFEIFLIEYSQTEFYRVVDKYNYFGLTNNVNSSVRIIPHKTPINGEYIYSKVCNLSCPT